MNWRSLKIGYGGRFQVVPRDEGCSLTVTHQLDDVEADKVEREQPGMLDQSQQNVIDKVRRICEGSASGD